MDKAVWECQKHWKDQPTYLTQSLSGLVPSRRSCMYFLNAPSRCPSGLTVILGPDDIISKYYKMKTNPGVWLDKWQLEHTWTVNAKQVYLYIYIYIYIYIGKKGDRFSCDWKSSQVDWCENRFISIASGWIFPQRVLEQSFFKQNIVIATRWLFSCLISCFLISGIVRLILPWQCIDTFPSHDEAIAFHHQIFEDFYYHPHWKQLYE